MTREPNHGKRREQPIPNGGTADPQKWGSRRTESDLQRHPSSITSTATPTPKPPQGASLLPYNFRHHDLTNFTMYLNGRQIPSESLSLGMRHEKTSVRGYVTLFEGIGIHHSNSGLQITHMYINGFFMIVYDLTRDSR